MKMNWALIISLILAVGLVSLVFTVSQSAVERSRLDRELETRTVRNTEEFYSTYLSASTHSDSSKMRKITERLIGQYRLLGMAIYYTKDSILVPDSSTRKYLAYSTDYIAQAVSADSSMGNFIHTNGGEIYEY